MRNWDLRLDFKAKIHWLESPSNRAEGFSRDIINARIQGQITEFEHRMEQYITEWLIKNEKNPDAKFSDILGFLEEPQPKP